MNQTKVCVCINWSVGWLVSIQEGVAERHLRQRVGGRGADAAQHVFPAPGAGPAWDLRPGGLPPGPHPGLRGAHGAQRRDPGPGPPHPGLPRHRRLPAGLQRMTFDPRDGPGLGSGLREVDGSEDHGPSSCQLLAPMFKRSQTSGCRDAVFIFWGSDIVVVMHETNTVVFCSRCGGNVRPNTMLWRNVIRGSGFVFRLVYSWGQRSEVVRVVQGAALVGLVAPERLYSSPRRRGFHCTKSRWCHKMAATHGAIGC